MDQQLRKNTLSLTLLQVGQYFVPLIILPYLTRVLGVEGFGHYGFATALTLYLVLVVEWGFNLSATREVSINRLNKRARSVVFWDTVTARSLLTVSIVLLLLVLFSTIPKLSSLSGLLWLGMLQVLAACLSSAFYYQGIERMGRMAFINLSIRLLSIPLILIFVRHEDQAELAFGIQTGCFLLASLVNLALLLRQGEIVWRRPQWLGVIKTLSAGFPLFLSSAGTSLYTNTNVIILGFMTTEAVVGIFVAGFTLVKAVVGLSGPFAQAIFPRASREFSAGEGMPTAFIRRTLWMQVGLGLVLSLALVVFMPWGVTWFYGEAFQEAVKVVAWLCVLPLVVCVASGLGLNILVPLGQQRWYSNVLIFSGLLNCLLLAFLGYVWGAVGAAIAVLVTECLIMCGMAIGVKKLAPEIWQGLFKRP